MKLAKIVFSADVEVDKVVAPSGTGIVENVTLITHPCRHAEQWRPLNQTFQVKSPECRISWILPDVIHVILEGIVAFGVKVEFGPDDRSEYELPHLALTCLIPGKFMKVIECVGIVDPRKTEWVILI